MALNGNPNGPDSTPGNWVGVGRSSSTVPAEAGRQAAKEAIAGRRPKLLLLADATGRSDLDEVLEAIRQFSPGTPLITSSASGEIAGPAISEPGVVVTAIGGECLSVNVAGPEEASRALGAAPLASKARTMDLTELGGALDRGEIQAHFQPIVDLRRARVIGVEGLARWDRPERGVASPSEFLALAEAGGLMRTLTERVIEFSARAAGDWWHSGLGLQLSVNLSPSTLCDPEWRLDEFVARTLARTGLPGKALQLEITEDALMVEPDLAAENLKRLTGLGATISIDDFGTGHSSLGRLKSLPIDELKIDRSFIFDLTEDEEDRTIVRSTIHLAHQMGLQVVAEGVETQDAWQQLRSMGCERAQGFLIAKPMPAREVPAWLASWNQQARELRSAKRVQRRTAKAVAIRRTEAEALA